MKCNNCGKEIPINTPLLTVDIIIEIDNGVLLIERKNEPYGWAIPGGFVDVGETVENAAKREALEETGLEIANLYLFKVYSDPNRDPRFHTVSIVFLTTARGAVRAGDDAANAKVFTKDTLPANIAFDHSKVLNDYYKWKNSWI